MGSTFESTTMGRIRFNYSFSNNFDKIRRLIVVYEEGQFVDLLDFRIRIIVLFLIIEYFHKVEKYDSFIIELNI